MAYEDNESNAPVALTVDDARQQLEMAKRGAGLQSLSVHKDHDGNSRILGFKIPKEILPAVETALPNAILWMQRAGSQFSHDKALWLANKLKLKDGRAQAVATAAEYGVRWGLIGIRPITDAIYSTKSYATARKELFREFKPVIEATGVDYKTNEVIRNAFDELHDSMIDNVKGMSADLLTLAPTIYVGIKDQRAAALKRGKAQPSDMSEQLRAEIEELKRDNKLQIERERILAAERQAFIETEKGLAGPDGTPLSKDELGKWFDDRYDERERDRRRREYHFGKSEEQEQPKKDDATGSQLAVLGLSLGSQIIKTNIREAAEKRRKGVNAWRMIQHLKEEMDAQTPQNSDGAGGYSFDSRGGDDIFITTQNGRLSLKEYILEIFQQHERDNLSAHSKKDANERQQMNPLGPALVEQLMPTVDVIAQYVADGRLNPFALVNLVGDNKIITHKSNGARSFAKPEEAEKIVDALVATMGTHDTVKEEVFFADFADPALAKKTVNTIVSTTKGHEKTAFIALIPDQILEKGGMKKQEIVAERKAGHKIAYDIVAAGTLSIATNDIEALKKNGLSEQQIAAVQGLAEKIQAGDEKAISLAVDGRDKTVLSALRTVVLNKEMGGQGEGTKFLANMVKKARGIPAILADAKKRREDAPAEEPGFAERFADEKGPRSLVDRAGRDDEPVAPRTV